MYTVNKFFEIIVRRVAGTADVLVIGSFLNGFERIGLRVVRCVVIEPNVEQAVVYSTSTTGLSTLTFRGEVVAVSGGVEERSEVMYCIEGDMYIYYR